MKRRDVIKNLTLLPVASSVYPIQSMLAAPVTGDDLSLPPPYQNKPMPELHRNSFVMDGHVHVMTRELLRNTDIGQRYPDGTVDLPRAIEGGLDAMFFTVFTPEDYYPGRFETKNTLRVLQLAIDQIRKNDAVIEIALNASDIERINKKGKMAAFLDLEGSFDLEGNLLVLRSLYTMGLRCLQLTAHNRTNVFIDSCNDATVWGGINEYGRVVIKEMNDLGMLINVAHASMDAIVQTAEASRHPIVYTHGGFRAFVDVPRCLSDEAAKALAAKGGVIGIQFGSAFNNPKYDEWQRNGQPRSNPGARRVSTPTAFGLPLGENNNTIAKVDANLAPQTPLVFTGTIPDEYWMNTDQLAKVIDYGVNLVGEDHIALGSDYDGWPELARDMRDISDYPQITVELLKLGYSEQRIRKILGLNWLRVIREVTGG